MNGHYETTKLLLQANANILIKNDFGETAIECAKMNGHNDIVKLIEEVGDLKPKVVEAIEKVLKEFNDGFNTSN